MDKQRKLLFLKVIHTVVWAFFASIIFFVLACGIWGITNIYTYIGIALVLVECAILLIFKWKCPITILADKYDKNKEVGFDIFLPKWLAKNNKLIFSIIFAVGMGLVILRGILGLF